MCKIIAVMGTLDTKRREYDYLCDKIRERGATPLLIDVSAQGGKSEADITSAEIAACGGGDGTTLATLSRSAALSIMTEGAGAKLEQLIREKRVSGIISIGGSGGTELAASVMRRLPLGFPKVLVSTLGSSPSIAAHVGGHDIFVLHSVADVSGINSITRAIFTQAAGAVVGAAKAVEPMERDEPNARIAATMYGLTTPCISVAKEYLEAQGYEVIVFHANGCEGRVMERLIRENYFDGVLDVTTTEVSAEVLGGDDSAGPMRMAGAAQMGIPCVVCPGAMDLVYAADLSRFPNRSLYCHNQGPSHFRPNAEDNRLVGEYFARQLNQSFAPCAVYIPRLGLSGAGEQGGVLYDPQADMALFETIEAHLDGKRVELTYEDAAINDRAFALTIAKRLHEMIGNKKGST